MKKVFIINDKDAIREFIRKNYAEVALNKIEGGCCSSSCSCDGNAVDVQKTIINLGYSDNELKDVPIEANLGLGCGNPIAIAALKEGEVVLDLGSGGGLDSFLARSQVGETGYVIGVDMTPEMIQLSKRNAEESGYSNIEFRLGEIENLPVADGSIDVIISNCVINLSPEKERVFKEAYRVLKPGGRLSISDVVTTAELPEHIRNDLNMIAGCIGGAEYVEDIRTMLKNAGFSNIRMKPKDNSQEIINTWMPDKRLEDLVASFIIEAEKN